VLRELGAEVIVYGNQPDGKTSIRHCGSIILRSCARRSGAPRRPGIAHDATPDRVLLCDRDGQADDGDDIMADRRLDMLAQGTLAKKTLVGTLMSNAGLEAAMVEAGRQGDPHQA